MSNYAQYEYLDVTVTDPQTRRDDKGEYTVYKVHFDTTFEEYRLKNKDVYRRYSQFVELKRQLDIRFEERKDKMQKFGTIPSLPGDTFLSLFGRGRFDPSFVAERCQKLDAWIKAVCAHNMLRFEKILISFLEEDEWQITP
ncbi:sorting nexin-3, putative [Entamoeba invadens IP1]|uniref:sorting nexin-3, putative n=1 Tax=Entamoeba invadens IP1 TaxID=370355 RepID=UPI0002C3E116|nr:sorting nexin-3, putative [Entamoeba invadens IP1]ELP90613.1 sorting nexin-3, putative [Entamoeba invadens IP1]|eukprot:XP_004257384.1 sorting nexin-3, putative [Entamoeba invadens IP1]